LLDGEILVRNNLFHQVADRNNTHKFPAIHNREMTHATFREKRQAFIDRGIRTDTQYIRGS
jgi:hypothetical protein